MNPQELPKIAFEKLFPERDDETPRTTLNYSGKFSDYNGNVKMIARRGLSRRTKPFPLNAFSELNFSISKKFFDVDESIQIGLLQHLINRVYGTKIKTMEQDFYNNFIKQLPRYNNHEGKESNALLRELFNELNEEYFNEMMDEPLLVFDRDSKTTLGHYQYAKDQVTISTILQENRTLLKFVLYHELLHKKHSFKTSASGRSQYHTPAFRKDEKEFSLREGIDVEKKLTSFVKKKKMDSLFNWF